MAKHDHKGRSKGERHVRLTHFMTGTAAWLSLKPAERAVYLEVARVYNGGNNGLLAISVRTLEERCNINKDTAGRALKVLQERGFIERVMAGGFSRKTRHAAEWRLTEWGCDKTHAPATKTYQAWRPSTAPAAAKCKTRPLQTGRPVPSNRTVTPSRSLQTGQKGAN